MTRSLLGGRASLVRERLLARLGARWTAPLIVVSAPAGYGKTTLLRQAMAANAARPAGADLWLRCAPVHTVLSSFAEALGSALELPAHSLARAHASVDDMAAVVVEAVWRRAPDPVALLVDDLQELPTGSPAARLLQAVVASMPSNGHVVLAGRSSPPFPVARREVDGDLVRLDQADLAFTHEEMTEFAALRGVPTAVVVSSGGWPALAELTAGSRADLTRDYVGQEVLGGFSPSGRRDIALLSHLGWFDEEVARSVLGPDMRASHIVERLPLVESSGDGRWLLHPLWQSFLAGVAADVEVAEARRCAGRVLLNRGAPTDAVPLLISAGAWGDLAEAVVGALSAAHRPVAPDVLADWFDRLPAEVRDEPSGQLLAGVAAAERDPVEACRRLEACAASFRARDDIAGELTCLVQLGFHAWWSDDAGRLGAVAARVIEMEAAGHQGAVPFARLGRALVYDMADDSQRMLAELSKIPLRRLNEQWQAMVIWLRAIAWLQLGYPAEAESVAAEALEHAETTLTPLIESTRLQALWFQGKTAEAFAALPSVIAPVQSSGRQNHIALAAAQSSVTHALGGNTAQAVRDLNRARAAIAAGPNAPLVDTALAVAEAAAAVVSGDEDEARTRLATYVERYPVGLGIPVPVQRRYLPLFYVLLPATRPAWDHMDLGPAWSFGRDVARAVIDVREDREPRLPTQMLEDPELLRAFLPPQWMAELAVGAIVAGREEGSRLLEATWASTRSAVEVLAGGGNPRLREEAGHLLRRFPTPPTGVLELRLLGPVELRLDGALVDAQDWGRERVRTLLIYLILHGTVSRPQLADALWPSLSPKSQGRNLRVNLTYLLRVIEPHRSHGSPSFYIRQHGNTMVLHPGENLRVDLWEFDEAYERATAADRRGAPSEFLEWASRVVELWRGEPTQALAEPWAIHPSEQRRVKFTATAIRAGELLVAQNQIESACELAERALTADPWLDAAHRLLVNAHRAAHDDLAAQRALDRYRASIAELGIEADQATHLIQRMLTATR